MELRLPTEAELKQAYERDMLTSFPGAERKPLGAILRGYRKGVYRPWCLFDGDELLGEAFVWAIEPGYALFDYLCVAAAHRNDGLGAAIIAQLLERERGNIVFGEAEIAAYAPDPAMAARRLAFYLRNGFQKARYDVNLFGVPYHTLYQSERAVDEDALLAAHERCYRQRMSKLIFKTCVRIPWDESMGTTVDRDWEE